MDVNLPFSNFSSGYKPMEEHDLPMIALTFHRIAIG
jgi:hypothetical protein